MIIAVDAMGGDFAPQATVQGSIEALDKSNKKLDIILLGDEKRINNIFKSQFLFFPAVFGRRRRDFFASIIQKIDF